MKFPSHFHSTLIVEFAYPPPGASMYRIVFVLGVVSLGLAYKHQQLDRFLGRSTPPKEVVNPTIEGLVSIPTTQSEGVEKIKTLLETGDINTRNQFGASPLILAACQTGDPDVVEFLHARGARLHDRDFYGNTALMCAAEAGNVRLVNWLLKKGVRIDQRNRLGQTALFFAAREGKYQTVRVLLNRGAKALMTDFLGRTPQHIATKNRHIKVAKLLQGKRAKPRTARPVY